MGDGFDIVFSLNKFSYPDRFSGRYVYRVVVDPENPLTALSYVCDEVQVCDLANPDAPCFVEEGQCQDWGAYQDLLNGSGGGGGGDGGDGGGNGGNSGSSGGCDPQKCPCPGPAPICGSGSGCCCGENQFCGGSVLNSGVWSCASCNCVPGSVFGPIPGTCVNPWRPGGADGVGF